MIMWSGFFKCFLKPFLRSYIVRSFKFTVSPSRVLTVEPRRRHDYMMFSMTPAPPLKHSEVRSINTYV